MDLSSPPSHILSDQDSLSLRRSNKPRNRPSYLKIFNCNISTHLCNLVAYNDIFSTHHNFLSSLIHWQEPKTYIIASNILYGYQCNESRIASPCV